MDHVEGKKWKDISNQSQEQGCRTPHSPSETNSLVLSQEPEIEGDVPMEQYLFNWEDFFYTSRRTRAISGRRNSQCAAEGQSSNEGKKVFYHCNYCKKDISGKIRIKCAQCTDFDLCVECFSVGVEVTPHKRSHPYRVMDKLSFPLISPDWNADEEMLLLEGIEMYGLENWVEVAEHVGTKNYAECVDHYKSAYLNSPNFPLPDMSRVAGKNKDELLAMAKKRDEDKKASAAEEKPLDLASVKGALGSAEVQDSQVEYIEGNEDTSSKGSSLMVNSVYNTKRNEFEPEYDHHIEQPITDLEFKDSDTKAERELKLRMLHIYNRRLDERVHRKNFVLERNLLNPDPLLKDLSPQEKEIYDRYNVFMRFHSKEEHEELIRTVIEEHRLMKSIKALHEAKRAGCSTLAEVKINTEQKKTMEAEESSRKENGSADVVPSGLPTEGQASTDSLDGWDIMGFPGSDLLSENDKRLCCEMKMLPSLYLKMQEDIATLIFSGKVTKRSDAYPYFRIDRKKIDTVYDVLVRKGIAHP